MHRLLWFSFLCLLSLRCAREVVIDLPEEPTKLVAVCHFSEGQNFRVKISLSQAVNEASDPEFLQDVDAATLSINGQFWDKLRPNTTDVGEIEYWESTKDQKAVPGVLYSLSVRVPGYKAIQSSSSIPVFTDLEPILIGAGDLSVVPLNENLSELRIPLELKLQELPLGDHFFAFNITHETEVYESFVPLILDHKEESQTNFLTDGRTFSLLHDIPEPVVLINENYWADDRRTLYLVARIPFDPANERPRRFFIEWRTLSPQFYRYHLSLSRQSSNLPFSDPDAVFNNIIGGYGNFSGYADSIYTVEIPFF